MVQEIRIGSQVACLWRLVGKPEPESNKIEQIPSLEFLGRLVHDTG